MAESPSCWTEVEHTIFAAMQEHAKVLADAKEAGIVGTISLMRFISEKLREKGLIVPGK